MCSQMKAMTEEKKIQFQAFIVHKLKVKRRTFFAMYDGDDGVSLKLPFCISRELKQIIYIAGM